MKNKLLNFLTLLMVLCFSLGTIFACDDGETHTHAFSDYAYNAGFHWIECDCGEKKGSTSHVFENGKCKCGYKDENHVHNFSIVKHDQNKHWYECSCGIIFNEEAHKGGEATCTERAVCTVCEQEYGQLKKHNYFYAEYDSANHRKECACGASLVEEHIFLDNICGCGYEKHVHYYNKKMPSNSCLASPATCTVSAKYYYVCECGEKGSAIYDLGAPAHDYIDHVCKNCQEKEVYTESLRYAISKSTGEVTVLGFEEGAIIPEKVIIPTKYQNMPVTAIGVNAFKDVKGFKQIQLPEGIKNIFSGAFQNSSLTSITIPSTVVQIHPLAFADSQVATVVFLVTEGWYSGRHLMSVPSADAAISPEDMAKASNMASTMSNTDIQSHGGNNYYYRIVK